MTSRTRFMSVSRLLAWVWQPRRDGTVATSQPSSSCSISTVNFLGVFTRSLGPQSITGQERGAFVVLAGLRREETAAVHGGVATVSVILGFRGETIREALTRPRLSWAAERNLLQR